MNDDVYVPVVIEGKPKERAFASFASWEGKFNADVSAAFSIWHFPVPLPIKLSSFPAEDEGWLVEVFISTWGAIRTGGDPDNSGLERRK